MREVDNKNNVFVENAILWTLRYFKKEANAGKIKLRIVFNRNFISDSDALDER